MAVAIEIGYCYKRPTERKSWAERTANKSVVVKIPDCCLTSPGITEHKVRMAVVVKISYYGRISAGDDRRGEVEFRAREIPGGAEGAEEAACDEHFAVGQQRLCVIIPPGGEAAGSAPGPVGRIVQFRAHERNVRAADSSGDEHLAVEQERRRVPISACGIEAACGRPGPAGRIVEFRARTKRRCTILSTRDEHLAVGQQSCRVKK